MSMYNARHLGRLPLPPGEGWGEGKRTLIHYRRLLKIT